MSPPGAIPTSIRTEGRRSKHYVDIARLAERGKFDLLFMADTNATFGPDDVETWTRTTQASRLEPITLLGALAAVTERIGLVATATTTYFEPFHVARFFASLDQISGGRAGWNLVTSLAVAEAYNFGRESHPHHGDRYARAREFAKVVLGLWDSFEDGAVIADKDSGIYFDAAKLHFLNHKGKHFAVRGPLTVHRSPQGHPVIVQAGQSDDGRDLAGETAEITFTVQQDFEAGRAFYADIKRRAAAYGRHPEFDQGDARRDDRDRPHPRRGAGQIRAAARAAVARTGDQGFVVAFRFRHVALAARRPGARSGARRRAERPRQGHGRTGAPREFDHPPALQARLRPARPPRRHRHRGRSRRRARTMVPRRRGRRLQHLAADGSARASRTSSICSFRNCSAAACSAPSTKARRLRENLGLPFPHNRWAVEREQKSAG